MAKEFIERDVVLKEQKTFTEYDEGGWDAAVRAIPVNAIKSIPAADVVEVVRCKDCKHRSGLNGRPPFMFYTCTISEGLNVCEENAFCSYGERRDNNAAD